MCSSVLDVGIRGWQNECGALHVNHYTPALHVLCPSLTRLCVQFGCQRVVVVRAPWSGLWVGWQPHLSDVPGPESLTVSSRCRHLHTGRVYVIMAGLTVSLNFHAHIRMCKSVRDPGCTLPLTLRWRVVSVYN